MRHIKVFDKFNHRIPKETNNVEFEDKINTHSGETFSQKELDFFEGIKKDPSIYELNFNKYSYLAFLQIYPIGEDDNLIEIDILKLKDDWYLISEVGGKKYICDEWDEVLGYLGTRTTISF